eukprot:c25663_g1_i1.p1 GENE.c25663_g1_i1~~c25663_g1_i1.p1  ORF type:complete len:241 (-),score=40.27 c25663_g1_i1:7-729(-)
MGESNLISDSLTIKSAWTNEEDEILRSYVKMYGLKNWSAMAHNLQGRTGKQCRERWRNHLSPEVRKDRFSQQEDEFILSMVNQMGTKWSVISRYLPGRTDNAIKNRYYSSLKRAELRKQKIELNYEIEQNIPTKSKEKKSLINPLYFASCSANKTLITELQQPAEVNWLGFVNWLEVDNISHTFNEKLNVKDHSKPLNQFDKYSTSCIPFVDDSINITPQLVLSAAIALCEMKCINSTNS